MVTLFCQNKIHKKYTSKKHINPWTDAHLNQLDEVTWSCYLRVILDVGFVGCQGDGGVNDTLLFHNVGLDLVNAGGTGHTSHLSQGTMGKCSRSFMHIHTATKHLVKGDQAGFQLSIQVT